MTKFLVKFAVPEFCSSGNGQISLIIKNTDAVKAIDDIYTDKRGTRQEGS